METLKIECASQPHTATTVDTICGVVGSGNLEVLLAKNQNTTAIFEINTSAEGFAHVWQAVLENFCQNHAVAGLTFKINDMGATPAVVSLRLSQAVAMLKG